MTKKKLPNARQRTLRRNIQDWCLNLAIDGWDTPATRQWLRELNKVGIDGAWLAERSL